MTNAGLDALRVDLKADARMLKAKRRIVRILERLPDDDARRRVLEAVRILVAR